MIKRIIPILIVILIFLSFVCINVFAYSFVYNNVTYYSKGYTLTYNADNTSFIDISSYGLKAYLAGSTSDNPYYSIDCNYIRVSHANTGNRGIYVTFSSTGSTTNYKRDQFQIQFIVSSGQAIIPSNVHIIIIDCIKYNSNAISIVFNNGGTASNPNTKLYNSDTHKGIFFNKDFSFSNSNFGISLFSDGNTLTFNSNGGSPIAPITDIEPNSTISLVDQFGFYLPQYVPTRTGFIFDYWYDIDNPVQAVRSLTVTEDTVLNAKYTVDTSYTSIYFTSGFYHDSACTNAIGGRVVEQIGSTYTFYYNSSNATGNFHGQITLDGNGYSKEYTGTEVSSGIYRYDIIVPSVETTVNVLTYETYDCTLYVFGGIWNDYVGNVYINGTPVLTEQQVVHFDGYTGIHLEFDMYPPYVITDIVFTDVLYGPFSYELTFNVSDTIVEMVGGDWGFYTHVDAYCYPNQDGVIQVWNRSITEYDITSRAPIIVYDESGNASWAFSEVDVMDTDWSQVQENIPRKLFGIFDGLFSLEGLAVLIPVIMMVSFTVWFLRRS